MMRSGSLRSNLFYSKHSYELKHELGITIKSNGWRSNISSDFGIFIESYEETSFEDHNYFTCLKKGT